MTLADIEGRLYARLGFDTAPQTAVINRLRAYINETQHKVLGKKNMESLRRSILTFSSVANSPFAVLPQAVVKVFDPITDRTNKTTVREMPLSDIRVMDPGLSATSGVPYGFVFMNIHGAVALQPSNASELFVISSSASDDNTKKAFIEGLTTGGYPRSASVALNGTTAASFGATITTWEEITKFYIALTAGGATTAAGLVTLREDSGIGTELSRISIGRAYARYSRVQLYPVPTAAITYHADVLLHIEEMSQATDESLIPEDFQDILIAGSLMKEYERREKETLYAQQKAEFKERLGELQWWVHRQPQSQNLQFSQLGSNYPAGS